MRRFRSHRNQMDSISEINVTPLLDLAFVLLIIFMISTPLLEEGSLPLKLPVSSTRETASSSNQRVQSLALDHKDQLYWGSKKVSAQELENHLKQTDPKLTTIHVRADAHLPYQKIVHLLDLLKKFNFNKIALDTQK